MDEFYTPRELATTLKISLSTVRRLIRGGDLSAIQVGKQRQIRIPASSVTALMASEPTSKYAVSESKANGASTLRNVAQVAPNEIAPPNAISGQTQKGLRWAILPVDVRLGLSALADDSVSCAVTSPPYYWQRDYEVEGQIGHEASIDGYVTSLVDTFRILRRKLHPKGTFFLNLGDTYYSAKGKPHGKDGKHNGRQMMRRHLRAVDGPGLGLPRKSLIGIPWRVALAMQQDGWTLRSSIIWHRPGTLPEPTAQDRPWRTHENVFVFSKEPRYRFNRAGLKGEEDVWKLVARPENPGSHFAPFPRELVDRCLDCGVVEGDIVLDPFVGSGTTMVSALSRGCHAIGIELKPEYAVYSANRVRKEFA